MGRFDWKTLQEQDVDPTLAYPGDYRSEWTLPLAFSPANPHALYYGNQFLFLDLPTPAGTGRRSVRTSRAKPRRCRARSIR